MSAIKKAFQAIGKGIEKAVHSVGQIAKGIVTLNLKAAAEGLKGLADATMTMARGAMNLMPAAMAANTLLDGALDKMLRKVQNSAQKLADSVVDSVEGGLSNIKDGVVNTAKGIARGNFSKAFKGLTQLAMGGWWTRRPTSAPAAWPRTWHAWPWTPPSGWPGRRPPSSPPRCWIRTEPPASERWPPTWWARRWAAAWADRVPAASRAAARVPRACCRAPNTPCRTPPARPPSASRRNRCPRSR